MSTTITIGSQEYEVTIDAEDYREHEDRLHCWNPTCSCKESMLKRVALQSAIFDGLLTETERINIYHGHTV